MQKTMLALVAVLGSSVFAAEIKEPSIEPQWSGASVGTWTMDYTKALKQAKGEGKMSLMLFTGSWWCPWCQPLETKVLDTAAWKDYATARGFYEIEQDYPCRDGVHGACWLWDEGFCSTNKLTEKAATTALEDRYKQQTKYAEADASTQVCTNGTKTVTYKRIGYPTMLVLRPNGSVAGRFFPGVRDGYDFEGNEAQGLVWSEEDAFAAVTNAIETIIANANTHVTTEVDGACTEMGTVTKLDTIVETGTQVTIQAKANKGYYFAGWYLNDEPAATVSDYRTANNKFATTGGDVAFVAKFVRAGEDFLSFDFSSDLEWFGLEAIEPIVLSVESATAPTISLSGLPTGLKFDAKTLTVSGTPKKEGSYNIIATGKNASGYQYVQVIACTVGEPEEPEPTIYDDYVDFLGLDDLHVGTAIEEPIFLGTCETDSAGKKIGITQVSGLPKGLSVKTETDEDGIVYYYVCGTPTVTGAFTVTAKVSCYDESETPKYVSGGSSKTMLVQGAESVFIEAVAGEGGTASGSAVYAAGATAKLTAKADRNYVFAGWQDDGETFVELEGVDYRNQSLALLVSKELATYWKATFVTAAEDAEQGVVFVGVSDGDNYSVDSESLAEGVSIGFAVDSLSLPTVKASGLPVGFAYSTTAVYYEPLTAKKMPTPGVYKVTLTAQNQSKASASVTFTITVANWTDEHILIDDIYPDETGFTPGVAIDPIDFSEAVEFTNGFMLAVSGLPKGLTFNAKADEKKGIAANTVTGTPSVPGSYTVTFTAKQGKNAYMATSTFVVAPYPELAITVDEDAAAAGNKVSGAGNYPAGKTVTLKAAAAKGWVFAGWSGLDDVEGMATLNPSLAYVTGESDVTVEALFIPIDEDSLSVYNFGESTTNVCILSLKQDIVEASCDTLISDLIETSSWPTLTVKNLPTGLKFDAKTLVLSGAPTKSGHFYATVTAKNAGGYQFIRVLHFAVKNADGTVPAEEELANPLELVFDDFFLLTSGEEFSSEGIVAYEHDGYAVTGVKFSGLPKGLMASFALEDDGSATTLVEGVPTAPGRSKLSVTVQYANRKSYTCETWVNVEDGGSGYIFVESANETFGTVTGEGVYAAGATVKLSAKATRNQVFSGWWSDPSIEEEGGEIVGEPFEPGDVDYRTATLSFTMMTSYAQTILVGSFTATTNDTAVEIWTDYDEWEINPDESSGYYFEVDSASLPTVTVKGLPKGITSYASAGYLAYSVTDRAKLVPGLYTVTIDAVNQSKAKAETVSVQVSIPIPENEFFTGYGLDQGDGYAAQAGMSVGEDLDDLIAVANAMTEDGLTVSFKNLPKGVTLAIDKVKTSETYGQWIASGTPTVAGTYTVTITAKGNLDGESVNETGMCFITVAALPETLVGTFNGVIETIDTFDYASESPRMVQMGSVSITSTSAGKITASVVRPTGKFNFKADFWDQIEVDDEGVGTASVFLNDGKGHTLDLEVACGGAWNSMQVSGWFTEDEGTGKVFEISAQRNPFGADATDEALAALAAVKGSYTFVATNVIDNLNGKTYPFVWNPKATKKSVALTVTIDAKGVAKFSGKVNNKAYSGSVTLTAGAGAEGLTLVGRLVAKYDAENVSIGTIGFSQDAEYGWSMNAIDDAGEISGATVEIYKSDCKECGDY